MLEVIPRENKKNIKVISFEVVFNIRSHAKQQIE